MSRLQAIDDREKQEIQIALQEYRQTVYERNVAELKYCVRSVLEQQPPPGTPDEHANGLRLDTLESDPLSMGIPDFIKTPSDLLEDENLELLRLPLELDGVPPVPDDSTREEYFTWRQKYFLILDEELRTNTIHEYQNTLAVPPDLRYLMELCDAVEGPGLGQHRYTMGNTFVSRSCNDTESKIRARVFKLNRKGNLKWPLSYTGRWEAAAGFWCGNTANGVGGGFALFCRSEDERRPWAWRYGLDTMCTHAYTSDNLYEDIHSFLKFFANCEDTYLNDYEAPRCFE